jgi:pimeloyl-ACP methyl ester carboxylesterase
MLKKESQMTKLLAGLLFASATLFGSGAFAQTTQTTKPTVVLVHGAFADGSSWNGVAKILLKDGYTVVAVANPLRSVKSDAQYVSDLLATIKTPVVLVGHSYGGEVISEAANGRPNVKSLVFVSALAPAAGETAGALIGKFPGSTLGAALDAPVPLADGGKDLYVRKDKFHAQFAADVPAAQAALMAAEQRPIAAAALDEAETEPAWKNLPSFFVYGDQDKNIPPKLEAFMAERAHAKQTVVVKGASHVVMLSHPQTVAKLIETAADAK